MWQDGSSAHLHYNIQHPWHTVQLYWSGSLAVKRDIQMFLQPVGHHGLHRHDLFGTQHQIMLVFLHWSVKSFHSGSWETLGQVV